VLAAQGTCPRESYQRSKGCSLREIRAYKFDIEETLNLDAGLGLRLDDTLVRAHYVGLGICGLHLEEDAFSVLIQDVNGAKAAALAIALVPEDHLNRVDDDKLAPLFVTHFDHSENYIRY